jgi:hypothetical protein
MSQSVLQEDASFQQHPLNGSCRGRLDIATDYGRVAQGRVPGHLLSVEVSHQSFSFKFVEE